jgi:hypothetical protein
MKYELPPTITKTNREESIFESFLDSLKNVDDPGNLKPKVKCGR